MIGHPHRCFTPDGGDAQGERDGDGSCRNHDPEHVDNDRFRCSPLTVQRSPDGRGVSLNEKQQKIK